VYVYWLVDRPCVCEGGLVRVCVVWLVGVVALVDGGEGGRFPYA
jgi:hypothetical protein